MKIGIPVLMLKGGDGYVKGKHAGNAKAVACEALIERWGSDDDIDRTRSYLNTYEVQPGWENKGFESGQALSAWWEQTASNYRRKVHCKDKDGNEVVRERKLGENTSIGFATILKPESDYMASLDEDTRKRFLDDLKGCALDVFAERGLTVQVVATHYDEQSEHMHVLGYDEDYQLGRKLTLPFFRKLNEEIPERMRQLGWSEVESAVTYDAEKVEAEIAEATQGMTDAEAKEYRKQYIDNIIAEKKRKKHGRSSKQYKADMDAAKMERTAAMLEDAARNIEDARQQADEVIEDATRESEKMHRNMVARVTKLAEDAEKATAEKIAESEQILADAKQEAAQLRSSANAQYDIAVRMQNDADKVLAREKELPEREREVHLGQVELRQGWKQLKEDKESQDKRKRELDERERELAKKERDAAAVTQSLSLLQSGQVSWNQIIYAVLKGVMNLISGVSEADAAVLLKLYKASHVYRSEYERAALDALGEELGVAKPSGGQQVTIDDIHPLRETEHRHSSASREASNDRYSF